MLSLKSMFLLGIYTYYLIKTNIHFFNCNFHVFKMMCSYSTTFYIAVATYITLKTKKNKTSDFPSELAV